MEAKKQLAQHIVELYHGRPAAIAAREEFEHTFQKGGRPNELPETALSGPTRLLDVSTQPRRGLPLACSTTMRVGQRRFYRIIVADPESEHLGGFVA